MAALLRRLRVYTLPVVVGVTSITEVAGRVRELLANPRARVLVDVVGFEYFDQDTLIALTELVDGDSRISLRGLDQYAQALLNAAKGIVDVRTVAEQSVTHLSTVSIVTTVIDRQPLDDAAWDEALFLARAGRRRLVTLDLRGFPALSAHQTLSLVEFSADLHRDQGTLIIVNAGPHVAEQLRLAGLHGPLLMGTDDPGRA